MKAAFITFMVLIAILGLYASIRESQRQRDKRRSERDRYSRSRNYFNNK